MHANFHSPAAIFVLIRKKLTAIGYLHPHTVDTVFAIFDCFRALPDSCLATVMK